MVGVVNRTKIIHKCKSEREDCCYSKIAYNIYADGETSTDWYMDDGEYYPPVYYCPYCGVKLESPTATPAAIADAAGEGEEAQG